MTKKVLIVGHGFVGQAVESVLRTEKIQISIIDPKYKTKVDDYLDTNPIYIFICVPTPSKDDGSQDNKILKKVINECADNFPSSILVIKSTVLPSFINEVPNVIDKIILNPEFLTERNAKNDLINASFQIFGGDEATCKDFEKFLRKNTICKFTRSHFVSIEVASLIKYAVNSFLALKVIFFNQFKDIFKNLNLSENEYLQFIEGVAMDERVGSSHMKVPGPDGRKGFGGACFPKDTNALLNFYKMHDINFSLLSEVISVNNILRKDYNSLLKRELDQNINFDNQTEDNNGD